MSLIYVWSPRDPGDPGSLDRFSSILEAERVRFEGYFGRPFTLERQRVGSTCVGQIHFDLGVTAWRSFARAGDVGLFWSGICEDFLGITLDERAIRDVVERAERDPKAIGEWDGRFALVSWNTTTSRMTVTPGAVESPTIWHTEGPLGWALGSRAAPLLELAGRPVEMDLDAAAAYAAFEYLIGKGPLFQGVERLRPRQQVVLEPGRAPALRTYVSLSDFLRPGEIPREHQDRVAAAADRLTERTRRQLRHSPNPVLLLTGGYDSRCIAAAAFRAGYGGPAFTSGPPDSGEVQIAGQVVRRLGATHKTSQGNPVRPLKDLIQSPARLEEWMRWTEGVDVIRQALPYRAFFAGAKPFPASKVQLFHGFGGGLLRGNRYLAFQGALEANTLDRLDTVIRMRSSRAVTLLRPTEPIFRAALAEIAAEVAPGDVTPAQWLTLYVWQNKCLRWGTDMFSARDLIDWHWTPYMDRILFRLTWDQTIPERVEHRFLVDLAIALAPALANTGYLGHGPPRPVSGILKRIREARRVAAHRRIWQATLLREPPRVWDQLVSREELMRLVEHEPKSEALWCLATAELTAKAFAPASSGQVPTRVAA